MNHPVWMLIPWAILSVSVGLKFWRFTGLVRDHFPHSSSELERFRTSLERTWQKDQQQA